MGFPQTQTGTMRMSFNNLENHAQTFDVSDAKTCATNQPFNNLTLASLSKVQKKQTLGDVWRIRHSNSMVKGEARERINLPNLTHLFQPTINAAASGAFSPSLASDMIRGKRRTVFRPCHWRGVVHSQKPSHDVSPYAFIDETRSRVVTVRCSRCHDDVISIIIIIIIFEPNFCSLSLFNEQLLFRDKLTVLPWH